MTDQLEQQLSNMEQEFLHWIRTDIARAHAITTDMLTLSEGAGPFARALALRAHGSSLRVQGRLPEALKVMNRSQALCLEAGEEVQWARTVIGTIPVLAQMDRYKPALRGAEQALEALLRHQEHPAAARLLNNMGAMYGNMGRPVKALRCFTRGHELAGQADDQALQARLTMNQALVLQQLGRYDQALSACARALRYHLRADEQVSVAKVLQAGAISLFQLGRFGKALRRFARARSTFADSSASRDVGVCDLYIAACYVELNRCEEALSRLHSVFGVFDPKQSGFQWAWARLYEGMALARLGRSDESLAALQKAHRWFAGQGYAAWAGRAMLEEADVRLSRGEAQQASRSANRAVRLFRTAHMTVDEARAELVVAEGCLLAGKVGAARQAADRAYPVFVRARIPGPTFRCLHLLGRIAGRQGNPEEARRFLTRAVNTAERVRATVQLAFRSAFLEDKSAAYADLVWLHLQQGRVREAHRLADLAKSRALVDTLAAPPERQPSRYKASDLALLAEMEMVRREYQALTTPVQPGPEIAVTFRGGTTVAAQRLAVEQRLAALWDEWELRQAPHVRPAANRATDQGRWFARLPENGCMVEYFVAGEHLVAFVSDRRGLRGWVELGSPDAVCRSLELLQLNMDSTLVTMAMGAATPPGLVRNARALLAELHQQIWAPLQPLINGRERAVIIPHGILHLVPFEALHDGRQYLVEGMELSLAPSRATWLRCLELGERPPADRDLALGYNADGALPYVDEEVRWVAGALGTRAYLGSEATVERLMEAGSCRVVHVAVHGEFRGDNPHFSTLLLANGPLTAADAARLELDAAVAVLSGCETGLSRVTRGEELMGMISAFLQAGCASVLASRWRVDDRITVELMRGFYEGLLAGRSKAASLRGAQVAMADRQIHPLCWAAFGLVGHSGSLS